MLIFANKVNVMNYESRDFLWNIGDVVVVQKYITSAKINISYSILFNLTTSYSSYFGGKKGISRNKTSFFLLMMRIGCRGMVWMRKGGREAQLRDGGLSGRPDRGRFRKPRKEGTERGRPSGNWLGIRDAVDEFVPEGDVAKDGEVAAELLDERRHVGACSKARNEG